MSQTTTLANLRQRIEPQPVPVVSMSMDTVAGFENMQRAAKLFSTSSIVPIQYQGEKGLSNCFIAIDMALRMGANPLLVMQNLYIVQGKPAWSAQFLIATFNKCGKFSAIRYEFQGKEGADDWGCRAVAIELATKERLYGPLITISLAKKEGWYGKPGSKWQSMPEMMLRYRAAAWFVRVYAPEIAMGLKTAEEVQDEIITIEPGESGVYELTVEELSTNGKQPETLEEKNATKEEGTDKKSNGRRKVKAQAEIQEPVPQSEHEQDIEENTEAESGMIQNPLLENGNCAQTQRSKTASQYTDYNNRHECPKTKPDGTQRLVTEEDCVNCKDNNDCPVSSHNLA